MRKNLLFLFLVLIGLFSALVLVFYEPTQEVTNHIENISFDSNVRFGGRPNEKIADADMKAKVMADRLHHSPLHIAKYHARDIEWSKQSTYSYLSSDLSMHSHSVLPRVVLSGMPQQQFRRYDIQNPTPQMMAMANYQRLQINSGVTHTHSHGGEMVATGAQFGAAAADCPHDDISVTSTGIRCNKCGAVGTLTGVGDGSGSVGAGGGITWVPIGDAILPMLVMALAYLGCLFARKK